MKNCPIATNRIDDLFIVYEYKSFLNENLFFISMNSSTSKQIIEFIRQFVYQMLLLIVSIVQMLPAIESTSLYEFNATHRFHCVPCAECAHPSGCMISHKNILMPIERADSEINEIKSMQNAKMPHTRSTLYCFLLHFSFWVFCLAYLLPQCRPVRTHIAYRGSDTTTFTCNACPDSAPTSNHDQQSDCCSLPLHAFCVPLPHIWPSDATRPHSSASC